MKKNKLFLLLFFLFSINKVNASHISGGDISYECVGQDSFLVTLRVFRDCAGVNSPISESMRFLSSCGDTVTSSLARQSFSETSMLCAIQIPNTTCNGGPWPGFEEHIYSGIVVLSSSCNSWTMSWINCCRNAQLSNVTNPGNMYSYISATLGIGADSCQSSPVFTSNPIPYVCLNTATNYNFGAFDPDGDSLAYFMSPGYEDSITTVAYSGTFSYLQPIAGANMVLDSLTGQLTFTPTALGVYMVVVRVEKYDRITGVLKGMTMRDIQFVVQSCSNNPPEIDSIGFNNVSGAILIDSNSLKVCPSSNISFDISVSDSDTSQTVDILHNIYNSLDSTAVVTITAGNPAVIHVDWTVGHNNKGYYNFTLTGIDDSCPFVGSVYGVFDITVTPGLYVDKVYTICAGDSAFLEASGGTNFAWAAISGLPMDTNSQSSGFNATCINCFDPIVFPNSTTYYQVVSNITSSCSNVDTVVVSVVPNFTIDAIDDSTICSGDTLALSVSTNPISGNYTYKWAPAIGLSKDSISNPKFFGLNSKSYQLEVSKNGCIRSEEVDIRVIGNFPQGNFIFGDSLICIGDSVELELVFGGIPGTNCAVTASTCTGISQSGVIGTMSTYNTSISFPSIYRGSDASTRHQILFKASELHAMGMNAGLIEAISFDNYSIGTVSNFDNLEVKMGCTSSNDLSLGWETGLSQVVAPSTFVVTTGWNKHTFTNAFNWDGVSNLVIEICYANAFGQTGGTVETKYSSSGFNSVRANRSFNGNACATTSWPTITTYRPNIKFDFCSGVNPFGFNYAWTPDSTVNNSNSWNMKASPSSSTMYQLTFSDTSGACHDTLSHNVVVYTSEFDASFDFDSIVCLNDGIKTLTPVVPGGIFTGMGVSTNGEFDPVTAGVGTWPVNYNISTPVFCANDSTVNITVLDLPDASFVEPEICVGSNPINLIPNTPGGFWYGFMVSDSIAGTVDPVGLPWGSYAVSYSVTTTCTNSDTGMVHIVNPFQFNLQQPSIDICQGDSINLNSLIIYSTNPGQGSNRETSFSDASGIVSATGIFDATGISSGSYRVDVEVTNELGLCGSSLYLIVEVREPEYVEIEGPLSFCIDQSIGRILVTPWMYGAGVSFSQRPLGNLGINDTLIINPYGQNGEFNPSLLGVGSWEISIDYENVYGCIGTLIDTIYVLDPPTNGVTNMGNYLTATAGLGYDYQWLDCDDNNSPILGATSATYTPGRKGRFAVEVKAGDCIITSDCYETWPVGITETETGNSISVYPNPIAEMVNISLLKQENVIIQVLDNTGKVIMEVKTSELKTTISLQNQPSGLYLIKVVGSESQYHERIIKK